MTTNVIIATREIVEVIARIEAHVHGRFQQFGRLHEAGRWWESIIGPCLQTLECLLQWFVKRCRIARRQKQRKQNYKSTFYSFCVKMSSSLKEIILKKVKTHARLAAAWLTNTTKQFAIKPLICNMVSRVALFL